MRTTTPALSSSAALARKRDASARPPAQRMEDLARVDHRPQPGAALGGALHRQQQRQQLVAVRRAGILAQRLAERQVLRAGLRREPRRVGRQEGERRLRSRRFSARLKCTRPTRFQAGFSLFRKLCRSVPAVASEAASACPSLAPQGAQHVRRQVLGARHHRRRQHQRGEFAFAWWRDLGHDSRFRLDCAGTVQAQRRHIAATQSRATTRKPAARPARPRRPRAAAAPVHCPRRTPRQSAPLQPRP